MHSHQRSRRGAFLAVAFMLAFALGLVGLPNTGSAQPAATPTARTCDTISTMSTPEAQAEMDMSGDDAGMPMEFDLHYIDMMIPHHEGIIALAQAALPELTDPRLQEIAQDIITNQGTEIETLKSYREAWYGSAEPLPMDDAMMQMMMEMMPSMAAMGSMDEMAMQMNPQAQVEAFCAADNPDLAFIDLVIPHHEMALASSQDAVERATRDELKAFAQQVIEDQQREIDELSMIRSSLMQAATPEA